jgi:hypothetical protein
MKDIIDDDTLIQFDSLYRETRFLIPQTNDLLEHGCKIVQSDNYDNQSKTNVLYKLITSYPNTYILY